MLAGNYHATPYQAWLELGYGALTARGRRRLTMAAAELGALVQAFEDVDRDRGPKDPPADKGNVMRVKEVFDLYEAAETPEREAFNAAVEAGAERRAKLGLTADDPPLEPV